MAGVKEYKELSCRDVGANCNCMVRAETEEEVLKHGYLHEGGHLSVILLRLQGSVIRNY